MQVPRYERQIIDNTLPNVQVTSTPERNMAIAEVAQAGKNLAGAIGGLGQEINREQVEQQLKVNQINVQNKAADYMNQTSSFLYGDNGQFSRQGLNALPGKDKDGKPTLGIYDATKAGLMDVATKVGSTLDNDVQKDQFAQLVTQHNMPIFEAALKHQTVQQNIALDNANKAQMVALKNSFAVNWSLASSMTDEDTRTPLINGADQAIRTALAQVEANGKQKGLDDTAITVNKAATTANMVGDYVQQVALTDPKSAQQIAERYQDKFTVEDWDKLQAKIHPQLTKMNARDTSKILIDQLGVDGAQQGVKILMDKFKDSPDLPIYLKQYQSDVADQKHWQYQNQTKTYEDTFGRVMDTLKSGGISAAQGILDNSSVLPSQRVTIQNFITKATYTQNKVSNGLATDDEKWANSYLVSGGLQRDLEKSSEYYLVLQGIKEGNLPELTPQQQMPYNLAAYNVNRYRKVTGQSQEGEQPNGMEQPGQGNSQEAGRIWYNQTWRSVKDAHPDWPDDKVYAFMTDLCTGRI